MLNNPSMNFGTGSRLQSRTALLSLVRSPLHFLKDTSHVTCDVGQRQPLSRLREFAFANIQDRPTDISMRKHFPHSSPSRCGASAKSGRSNNIGSDHGAIRGPSKLCDDKVEASPTTLKLLKLSWKAASTTTYIMYIMCIITTRKPTIIRFSKKEVRTLKCFRTTFSKRSIILPISSCTEWHL
jgi:hypothetical protein